MTKRYGLTLTNLGKVLVILLLSAIAAGVSEYEHSGNAAASQAQKPAGLETDYCSPELRAKVEQLKVDAAKDRTSPKNSAERLPIVWEWANARAADGHPIPNNLPLTLYYDRFFADMAEHAANARDPIRDVEEEDVLERFSGWVWGRRHVGVHLCQARHEKAARAVDAGGIVDAVGVAALIGTLYRHRGTASACTGCGGVNICGAVITRAGGIESRALCCSFGGVAGVQGSCV